MNFIRSSYISAISNFISICTKLVVTKIAAIYIGSEGFAIYGQFKDFLSLATTISQLGTENGIVKYTAETKDTTKKFNLFLGNAIFLHIVLSLATTISIILFRNQICNLLFGDNQYANTLSVIASSLIFIALYNFFMALLNGLKLLKQYIFTSITATLLTAIITIIAVMLYNINGLLFSIAINNIIILILIVFISYKKTLLSFTSNLKIKFHKKNTKKLLNYSLMSITGMAVMSLSMIFIRTIIIEKFGKSDAGIWDSLWRISSIYFTFLIASFKFYLLPTFTSLKDAVLKKEILKIWKITFPVIILITGSIFILKDFIIKFLFTSEFLAMKSIMIFQLLGDVFRIHGWTLDNVLIARAKTKAFVILEIIWGLNLVVSSYILMNMYGLVGATLGYCYTCLVHFILTNIVLKNIIWNPVNVNNH